MFRTATTLLTVALMVSTQSVALAAPAKSGSVCSKAGKVQTINKSKLVCTKVGKKLVWKAVASKPAPAPTKVTWDNYDYFNHTIDDRVFAEFQALPKPGVRSNLVRTFLIGPNTEMNTFTPEPELIRAEKLLSWAGSPMDYVYIYNQCPDAEWATNQYRRLLPSADPEDQLNSACKTKGSGGIAWLPEPTRSFVNIYGTVSRRNGGVAFLDIHEFIHVLQYSQASTPSETTSKRFALIPKWIVEGQAQFLAAIAAGDHSAIFENFMDYFRYQPEKTTANDVDEWLKCACTGSEDSRNYALGAYATLALSSIYGVPSTMQLVKVILDGSDFESAVVTVFGEPWSELRPKLAKYIVYLQTL